jgi:RNA polymerase sigma factor (sigma-70 family)
LNIQQVFEMPVLKNIQIDDYFVTIDVIIKSTIKLIDNNSNFIRDKILDYYVDIASGTAKFKNYFAKEITTRKDMKIQNGFSSDDKAFLIKSHKALHLFYKKFNIEEFEFNRFVWYSIIEDFLKLSREYVKISENIGKKDYVKIKEKEEIEDQVKVKNGSLYGLVKQVNILHDEFVKVRNELIEPYFRYVYSLAKTSSRSEEHLMENFQAGVMGLIRALLLFNGKSSFGNYIKFWIKQSIMDNVYKSFLIKIPSCSWTFFNKLEKVRPATQNITELSRASGLSKTHISDIYSRVLLSQVSSLDMIVEQEGFNVANISYNQNFEVPMNDDYHEALNKDEQFLTALIFGDYDKIELKINEDEIDKERIRQTK